MSQLLEKYIDSWMPEPNTGCCIWLGFVNGSNQKRPRVTIKNKQYYLTRLVCEETHGPLRDDEVGRHTCHVEVCINPQHIIPGTQTDNERDKSPEKRSNASRKAAVSRAANRGREIGVRQKRGWWIFEPHKDRLHSRHLTLDAANEAARGFHAS